MEKIRVWSLGSCLALLSMHPPLHAGETAVPVVWESPGCEHEKLGVVVIEAGERVSEITQDPNVPTVDYARAVRKLADAAATKGANVVVLRNHQGVYFTRNGKRTLKPVYVKLSGAAIRMPAESLAQCPLRPVEVAELEARSLGTKAQNVSSRAAFAEDDSR